MSERAKGALAPFRKETPVAVTTNTGTVTPVVGAETVAATIAGGPLDLVSVYIAGGSGGGGGPIGVNLYGTVAGTLTLVGAAQVMGNTAAAGTLVEFLNTGAGATGTTSQTNVANTSFIVNAGAGTYTVKVIDLSTQPVPPGGSVRQAVTVTISGVNEGDTAADAQQTNTGVVAPGTALPLATIAGYAQEMDVAVSQTNIVSGTMRVFADSGGGTVLALVKSVNLSGVGGGTSSAAACFRNLILPVATRYLVSFLNTATVNQTITLTACTFSGASGGGGGVVVLTGNTNGPSNANHDEWFVTSTTDADVTVAAQANPIGFIYEGLNGLTNDRTVFLNPGALIGDETIIKDEDGSLAVHNIIVDPGGGNTIDGGATFTMTAINVGIQGSISVVKISATAWAIV